MREIYLDNSTTTKPSEGAVEKMLPFLEERWGSPTAPHQWGQRLFPSMDQAYDQIYRSLGASEQAQFIFTSSGAEAVNHVVSAVFHDATLETGQNHFLTSTVDEAPAIMAMGRLEQQNCVSTMLPVNEEGILTAETLRGAINPRTALLSLSWANGLTGVIQPVAELAEACQERGIVFHLEASHVLGKLYLDLEGLGVDVVTFSGDLLHGPKSSGGLYVKPQFYLSPLILGGGEQGGQRAGTLDVAGLVALGHSLAEAQEHLDFVCMEVARLRDKLEDGLLQQVPGSVVFYQNAERVPHITAMGFPGVANDALLFALSRKGVYGSFGGGHFQRLGLILEAAGVDPVLANSALSFSLSRYTTEEEVDEAIEIIAETVKDLQRLSVDLNILEEV